MTAARFQIGDRVRLRTRKKAAWRGALVGTIQRVYHSLDDTYDVLLDEEWVPRMLPGRVLVRIAEDQQETQAP